METPYGRLIRFPTVVEMATGVAVPAAGKFPVNPP